MNETISTKYGFAPETIEKRSLNQKDGPYFNENYDFVRLRKVEEKKQIRNAKYNQKIDRRKRTLRSPFKQSSEIVFVLVERLKKKDAPSKLFKASTENMPFSIEIELKMNPDFTYFKEIPFGENNKFTLRFFKQRICTATVFSKKSRSLQQFRLSFDFERIKTI